MFDQTSNKSRRLWLTFSFWASQTQQGVPFKRHRQRLMTQTFVSEFEMSSSSGFQMRGLRLQLQIEKRSNRAHNCPSQYRGGSDQLLIDNEWWIMPNYLKHQSQIAQSNPSFIWPQRQKASICCQKIRSFQTGWRRLYRKWGRGSKHGRRWSQVCI